MNNLKNYITFVNENLNTPTIPSEDELLDVLKSDFKDHAKPNSTFPVEVKDKSGKVIKVMTFHIDVDGELNIKNDVNENKFVKGLAALCLIGGTLTSCSDRVDIKPNDTKTQISSVKDQNIGVVDFLNTDGKNVTIDEITNDMAKVAPKPIKSDTNQYKQPTMKSNIKRVEIRPDSVVVNSNTPWIGYWKFTDECRSNNHQVMIWSQVGDNPLDGIIYSGYQVGADKSDWSQYQLIDGKGYFLSAYKISSFNYDKANKRITAYISAPDVDKGATTKIEIAYNGNEMYITNWGGGRAVRVGGMGNFKW